MVTTVERLETVFTDGDGALDEELGGLDELDDTLGGALELLGGALDTLGVALDGVLGPEVVVIADTVQLS